MKSWNPWSRSNYVPLSFVDHRCPGSLSSSLPAAFRRDIETIPAHSESSAFPLPESSTGRREPIGGISGKLATRIFGKLYLKQVSLFSIMLFDSVNSLGEAGHVVNTTAKAVEIAEKVARQAVKL